MGGYLKSCKKIFWKDVFKKELDYVLKELNSCKNILSVGCGPAIIERELEEHSFNVTGLDISKEALEGAPDSIRTVVGSAEHMDFDDESFDAAIYVASLQFIQDYKKAIQETKRVLKPKGKLLIMMLNPESEYFKEKTKRKTSYLNKIKHKDLKTIEEFISKHFSIETEYFLGIKGRKIFDSNNPKLASLYVIKAKKI